MIDQLQKTERTWRMYDLKSMVQLDGYSLEETTDGTRLFVNGRWTPTVEGVVQSGRIREVVLNYAHGFSEPNLEFLRPWPIVRLDVLDRTIRDLGPISRLQHFLTELVVGPVHPSSEGTLDLSGFDSLRTLSLPWSLVKSQTEELANVTDLFFLNYQGADLTPLSPCKSLSVLRMKHYPQIQSLNGIGEFEKLHRLSIHGAAKLTDLSPLRDSRAAQNLMELQLESCKRITVLDEVASAANVRFLNLGNCADIASLQPLQNLRELRRLHLYESTKALDGDLTPLLSLSRLNELKLANRRNYRPSVSEIEKQLGLAK